MYINSMQPINKRNTCRFNYWSVCVKKFEPGGCKKEVQHFKNCHKHQRNLVSLLGDHGEGSCDQSCISGFICDMYNRSAIHAIHAILCKSVSGI